MAAFNAKGGGAPLWLVDGGNVSVDSLAFFYVYIFFSYLFFTTPGHNFIINQLQQRQQQPEKSAAWAVADSIGFYWNFLIIFFFFFLCIRLTVKFVDKPVRCHHDFISRVLKSVIFYFVAKIICVIGREELECQLCERVVRDTSWEAAENWKYFYRLENIK